MSTWRCCAISPSERLARRSRSEERRGGEEGRCRWDWSSEVCFSDLTDALSAAIDSYSVNRDVDLAVLRYQSLGEAGPTILAGIQADPGEVNPAAVADFAATVELYEVPVGTTPTSGTARPTSSEAQYLLPVCGVTLVLGLLLVGVVLIRGRSARRV